MNKELLFEEHRMELENRIRNLMWTVSGDYGLEMKVDVEAFFHSRNAALYDGIKQGGLAYFYDREALSLYLVKKIYCEAMEGPLMQVASLCIEEAVGQKLNREREGIQALRKKAYEEILDQDFKELSATPLGHLEISLLREELDGTYHSTKQIEGWKEEIHKLRSAADTMDVIRMIDRLYNQIVEPGFEKKKKTLEEVLQVTIEELAEYSWKDFLSEDLYEDALEAYLEQVTESITSLDLSEPVNKEEQENEQGARKVVVVDEAALEKMYSYGERNYGKPYLSAPE